MRSPAVTLGALEQTASYPWYTFGNWKAAILPPWVALSQLTVSDAQQFHCWHICRSIPLSVIQTLLSSEEHIISHANQKNSSFKPIESDSMERGPRICLYLACAHMIHKHNHRILTSFISHLRTGPLELSFRMFSNTPGVVEERS